MDHKIILINFMTLGVLAIIGFLAKVIMKVDKNQCAMEVRIKEHGRRIYETERDIKHLQNLD